MPTRIDETVLQGIFNARQQDAVTTQAQFWNFSGDRVPTYPTVFVPGNTEMTINGQTRVFSDGAFVFQRDGQLAAVPAASADGGGITVAGGPVRPVSIDIHTNRPVGNTATLQFSESTNPGTSSLTLRMPEGQGAGFHFRYPAASAEDLLQLAQQKNAIVQLKGPDGKILEGFFAKNSGGALPKSFGPYAYGAKFDQGDFLSVTRQPNGEVSLFPYKNFTPKEMEQATRFGTLSEPGNNLARLQTLDGKPVNPNKFPQLDTRPALTGAPAKLDGPGKTTDTPQRAPEAQQPDVDAPANRPALETPDGKAPVDAPAPGEGLTALGKIARIAAPVALAALPTIEGLSAGYQKFKNGGSALDVAEGTVVGVGEGVADTFLPGARSGYSDVTGGDKTVVDRLLNAASDATGTATAIGTAAIVAEAAGVVSIPAVIPTGIVTVVAGISNLGINAAKGVLKATGLSGADQDGGYIYDGGKLAVNEVNHLMGWDKSAGAVSTGAASTGHTGTDGTGTKTARADFDPDHLLSQSVATWDRISSLTIDRIEGRHVG